MLSGTIQEKNSHGFLSGVNRILVTYGLNKKKIQQSHGDFLYRRHSEPRVQLVVQNEETFPLSQKYIDATRSSHTDLDVMQERRTDDYWNVDTNRSLLASWKGFTKSLQLHEEPPKMIFGVQVETDNARKQVGSAYVTNHALQKGLKLDQSLKVNVVLIMGTHGLEIAIPSKRDHLTTSSVLISRGKNRLVDEVHLNVSYIVASTELLSERSCSKETEPCDVTDTRSRRTGGEPHSCQATGFEPCHSYCETSVFHERNHFRVGRKWRILRACPAFAGRT